MARKVSRVLLALAVATAVFAAPVLAQRAGIPGGAPPRDGAPQPAGSAVIRGRVLTADGGSPVRRAQVRATAAEARVSRLATTDAQGRFELKELPAGRWVLTASKAGLVTLQYGQRRPFESGRALEIRDGDTLERADIFLPRGSAITGHVVDEFGDPVATARVQVLRYQLQQGVRRLVPVGVGDQTDDTGAFRIFGLAPGEYFVSATLRAGPGTDGADGVTSAPTYYPGTNSLAEAQRVVLAVAQEQGSVNFPLLPGRTVRISGLAVSAAGDRLRGGLVTLVPSGDMASAATITGTTGRVLDDGTFTLANVAPGTYTLAALSGGGGRRGGGAFSGADAEFASLPVVVGNEDLTGLTIVTAKGASLTGRVIAADDARGQLTTTAMQVVAQGARPELQGPFAANRTARVANDGSFTMSGVNGQRLLRLMGLPSGWMLKAVMVGTTDITDQPVDFTGNAQALGIDVVVTDRVTAVNGTVVSRGRPVQDYSVVVFPEDEDKWRFPTRFVQSARPDQQGVFVLRALPPGERYLAVAVDYLENGEANDPLFLSLIRSRASAFALGDGESKALALTLVTR